MEQCREIAGEPDEKDRELAARPKPLTLGQNGGLSVLVRSRDPTSLAAFVLRLSGLRPEKSEIENRRIDGRGEEEAEIRTESNGETYGREAVWRKTQEEMRWEIGDERNRGRNEQKQRHSPKKFLLVHVEFQPLLPTLLLP